MIVQDLHSLKYSELQKLAKSVGIRANQKVEKLITALTNHYVEVESDEKEGSSIEDETCTIQATNDATAQASCFSSTVARPSSSDNTLNNKKIDEGKVQTPNQHLGRKRRHTFDLNEASLQGNTPTIDGETNKQARLSASQRASSGCETNKDATKKQRRGTFDKELSSIPQSGNKKQPPAQIGGRKRRRTFELEETSLQGSTPTVSGQSEKRIRQCTSQEVSAVPDSSSEHVTKRQRRSIFSEKKCEKSSSPGTKAIIDAMDANCSSSERRERLLAVINKKVQNTVTSSSFNKAPQPSLIPRFTTFVINKKKDSQQTATPGNKDWKKIHNKEFSRFDSIDVYLEKKKQRQDQLSSSAKKSLPFGSPASKAKPTNVKPVNKNPGSTKIFQPQVMKTKNINLNFSKMASGNKTPSRQQSVTPARGTTPGNKSAKRLDTDNKATGGKATPFRFTGNSSVPKPTAPGKTTFDLKASLARPITWKPHTGKLQPLDINKEETVPTQKLKGAICHRSLASKTRSAQVKNVQRTAMADRRTNKKYMDMMRKRGLLA